MRLVLPLEIRWLIGDVVAHWRCGGSFWRCGGSFGDGVAHYGDLMAHWRCGGSLVAHQTSRAEVPGSNPASSTMILGRCRIIV